MCSSSHHRETSTPTQATTHPPHLCTSIGSSYNTLKHEEPFKPFKGASETDIKALHEYVAGCNQALREGKLSPTGRVATKGTEIDRQAKRAARQERRAHPEKYPSPDIVAGHVPDSTWLGHGNPPRWQAMSSKLNSSLAGQNNNYPVGYKPTEFLVGEGD